MTNFILILDTNHNVDISYSWLSSMGADSLTLDPTLTVTGVNNGGGGSSGAGGKLELSFLLLVGVVLCSFF